MFKGAVAKPATAPDSANSPALVTHSMAALPQAGLIRPTVMSSVSRFFMSRTSTTRSSRPADSGSFDSLMRSGRPVSSTARCIA